MSTETRIGIVAGLLIVVVASVYFFYGNRHAVEDVLVVADPKPADPLKIPRGENRPVADKLSPAPHGMEKSSSQRPAPPPASPSPRDVTRQETSLTVGPLKDQAADGMEKYRLPVPLALVETSAPLLRTNASQRLVEATNENLRKDTPAGVPVPVQSASSTKTQPPAELAKKAADAPASAQRVIIAPDQDTPAVRTPAVVDKTKPTPLTPARTEKTYIVQPGDTFYGIARSLYKNGSRWEEIFALNKAQLRNDPKRLRPGMILKLPAD